MSRKKPICPLCNERPKIVLSTGMTESLCRECKQSAQRDQKRRARSRHRMNPESVVPIELRIELAGFARELGFGR